MRPSHVRHSHRHAHQLRRLPERPQARRHPERGHQRVREPARLLRLGRAVRAVQPRSSTRWPRSSACTSSPSRTRATATSAPRSRSTATRCSRCCTRRARDARRRRLLRAARSTSSSAPTTCCRCGTARDDGFADVRARTEREPELLQHGSGYVFYALMDDVVDRYFPVLDALETELEAIEEQIFARNAGALEHRGALRAEAEADGAEARGRPADGGDRQAVRRARAADLRRA